MNMNTGTMHVSSIWRRQCSCTSRTNTRLVRQMMVRSSATFPDASSRSVDVEEAKRLLERGGYKLLDIRSEIAYEQSHITKPSQISVNIPFMNSNALPSFMDQVSAKFPGKGACLLVMCQDGGLDSEEALLSLFSASYINAMSIQGGYAAWVKVWTPSGKRRPPPGRWISTGTEALKSGLNIPGVAESYDEGGNLIKARYVKDSS